MSFQRLDLEKVDLRKKGLHFDLYKKYKNVHLDAHLDVSASYKSVISKTGPLKKLISKKKVFTLICTENTKLYA